MRAFPFRFYVRLLTEAPFIKFKTFKLFDNMHWDKTEAAEILPLLDSYKIRAAKSPELPQELFHFPRYLKRLDEMRQAILLGRFPPGTRANPDAHANTADVRHHLRYDANAVGESSGLNVTEWLVG